jgi:hypothetical protein
MSRMKRRVGGTMAAVLVVLASVALAACGASGPEAPRSAPHLVVIPSVQTIAVGERVRLKAYVRRSDGSVRDVTRRVRWTSSDPRTVVVKANGLSLGHRKRSATISARLGSRRATARIAVRPSLDALRVSRANPRYFEDPSGRPVYLAGAHTWGDLIDNGVGNPPPRFDYRRYLDFLQAHNLNVVRLWAWEQARWATDVESDYWFDPTVYVRTGPGTGLDGRPRFDLTQFNDAYFARLRRRVVAARERGMYAVVMLFDGWSIEAKGAARNNPWRGHPFNAGNNVNGIDGDPQGTGNGRLTHTLGDPAITRLQDAYVRRVVDAVADQPTVLFEVSNESSRGSIEWQNHVVATIRSDERGRPLQHPAGITAEWPDGRNDDLLASDGSWIAPNGRIDDPDPADGTKVILADSDHLCGVCGNVSFPWKAMARGLNPMFMDVYDGQAIGLGAYDGDADNPAWEQVRRSLGATRVVAERLDLARLRPLGGLASSAYCLADPRPGGTYLVYVPAGRTVTVDLSGTPGRLRAAWILPDTGETVRRRMVTGGQKRELSLPFSAPAVLLLRGGR